MAEASVTLKILQGISYNFNSNNDTTGVKITFNELNSSLNASATVTSYNYAPVNPQFNTTAPVLVSNYFKIEGTGITSYTGEVVVNVNNYHAITNPKKTLIYARSANNNTYTALATSYDSSKNELTFTASTLGDFAFGIPQTVDSSYAPIPSFPKDSAIVENGSPVVLVWGTRGIVQTYHLQVSTDASFSNLAADVSNLTSTSYMLNTIADNTTYYWRLNNTNEAGTSEWSETRIFTSASPFIKIIFPNGGEELKNDSTYIIRWESNINDSLNVYLVKGNTTVNVIGDSIFSGTNAISWKVSTAIQMDSTYRIKIASIKETNVTDESDTTFSIKEGITGIAAAGSTIKSYRLYQNYPNPFNPSTVIEYTIPEESQVKIDVYNSIGQRITTLFDGIERSGNYKIRWTAANLSSGVYFYSIRANTNKGNKFFNAKKMILLK